MLAQKWDVWACSRKTVIKARFHNQRHSTSGDQSDHNTTTKLKSHSENFQKKIIFFAVFCIDFTIVWSSQIYSQRIGRNQRIGVFANSKQKTWNFGGSRRRFYSNSGPRSFKKTWKRRSIIKKKSLIKETKPQLEKHTEKKFVKFFS